jgi:CIC family chloride channel protein
VAADRGHGTPRLLALREALRSAPYLRKWVVLGALIGVIGGLGAIIFSAALDFATHAFLGSIAGYLPPSPLGEGGTPVTDAARPWLIPLVVAGGGLIAGIIVFRWAPEAEGHGTDAAIAAYHHHPRRIRARIPLIKLVASAVTIGSGGSGGREGPTAQISAGFGSFLSRVLDLEARDARIAVAAGMAAGIGAIFRAPLGGAILGAEILYRDDVESDALVPAFIASIVAYSIFGAAVGFEPIFGAQGASFGDPRQLGYYAVIGLAAGVVGRVYIRSFYGMTAWFRGLRLPPALRPAIAGLAVGGLGLLVPGVLGTGYGWVQVAMDQRIFDLPLWVILVLPFAKILATSLTIGSGGSGGIFGPGMVIGGLLGAGIWRLLDGFAPGLPVAPAPFVIVAMMALFGSIAHAPLAVMLMVAEMTGNLGMLAPAMIAVGLATVVVGEKTIYASQLGNRSDSPAHRFRFATPLLASISAAEAMRTPRVVLHPEQPAADALRALERVHAPGAPVVEDGKLIGVATFTDLRDAPQDVIVRDLADPSWPVVDERDGLDEALEAFTNRRASWVPVVRDERFTGILGARDLLNLYKRARKANVRRLSDLADQTVTIEGTVTAGSRLEGSRVAEGEWPRVAVVVAVRRDEELLVPRGDLVLRRGDRVALLAPAGQGEALRAFLAEAAGTPDATVKNAGDGVVATLTEDAAAVTTPPSQDAGVTEEFRDTP